MDAGLDQGDQCRTKTKKYGKRKPEDYSFKDGIHQVFLK
jgi:hypothetical protein